ncbi:phospholipid scramblase 2-like isoform X2 [Rhinoraja longicauda]
MAAPGSDFQQGHPPGAYPPGAYPPGAYPPGAYPPGAYPPGAYPPGVHPPGAHYAPQASTGDKGEIDLQRMPMPLGIPNCPPGLEYLTQVDQLLVHQQVELLEALTGFETNNKFQIKNSLGQQIFFAAEENDCCTRNCCGNMRPFDMKIINPFGQEIMSLYRPLKCTGCCFPCCLQEITNLDETESVGKITKQWTGLLREAFTDADNFGIQFPLDLDVKVKAVLLAATFLIDFLFFEKSS